MTPFAFCYEDSLIITDLHKMIDTLTQENARLRTELVRRDQNLKLRMDMAKSMMEYSAAKSREVYGG